MAMKTTLRRTTVTHRPLDLENLATISACLGGVSNSEADRRALQIAADVLVWTQLRGGSVIFRDAEGVDHHVALR